MKTFLRVAAVAAVLAVSGRAQSLEGTFKPGPPTPELNERGKAEAAYWAAVRAEYRERARRALREEAGSDEALYETAAGRARSEGADVFDMQRVEVTGWWSWAPDDVEREFRDYFAQRIALSYMEPPPPLGGAFARARGALLNKTRNAYRDAMDELRDDRRGILSARAMEKLAPLSGLSIREIWAHSWATDALYNAILYGVVRPPRKLVLLGMPNRNLEKWRSLAHATGTEVSIYGFDQDAVSRSYYIPYQGLDGYRLSAEDFPGALTQDPAALAESWNGWVLQNPGLKRTPPGDVSVLWNVPGRLLLTHFREHYYNYLIRDLSWAQPLASLSSQQQDLVRREAEEMVEERTNRLLKESPPPAFQYGGDFVARAAPAPPRPVLPIFSDSTSVPCLTASLEKACAAAGGMDRLPSACGEGRTLMQASAAAIKSAAQGWAAGSCPRELAGALLRETGMPASHGFYSLELMNQHARVILAPPPPPPAPAPSSPGEASCREECRTEPKCEDLYFVERGGFRHPRRHCPPERVCRQVCR